MITPPATLGVLGGGQLGRYFVMAARTMGYGTMVVDPDPQSPAGKVADRHLCAPYDDPAAMKDLATTCAVVTTEFENPPASALEWLSEHTIVRPSSVAVATTQDRRTEKSFLDSIGIPIANYRVIQSDTNLPAAADLTYPAILKTARLGYDGRGQLAVAKHADLAAAWHLLDRQPCVLEERVHLSAELSIVLARGVDGAIAAYAPAGNTHVDGILDCTVVPVSASGAVELAERIATALDYVGVLAVEMFVVGDQLLVNELAPRPHNSGHWTLDAARTSQFTQQVRAICGGSLGEPGLVTPAVAMVNLLGDLWADGEPAWDVALAEPHASLHLYGKAEPRPGRKMGHLTVTASTVAEAERSAKAIREALAGR